MIISLISAMAKNRVIGKKNNIPWKICEDLDWFKKHTMNKTIVMGRKTFESIGKTLPNRRNIILSHTNRSTSKKVVWLNSVEEVISQTIGFGEIMIIGGEKTYASFLPIASKLYLTYIYSEINGDAYFPKYVKKDWNVVFRSEAKIDRSGKYRYHFEIRSRR